MIKWLALLFMLFDHFGYIMQPYISEDSYVILRTLGRLVFPIFVYYLVLGINRTSNLKSYMIRLGIFAIISEIVIRSLGMFTHPFVNVLFSLFAYALIIIIYENKMDWKLSKTFRYALIFFIVLATPFLEYSYFGLLVFLVLYVANSKLNTAWEKRIYSAIFISLIFLIAVLFNGYFPYCVVAGVSGLLMFNDKLDKRIFSKNIEKWTFYVAYPVQWIMFYLILNFIYL